MQKRIKSKENLEKARNRPCIVCGRGPCDPHHIRSRGAGGGDEMSNLLSLCRVHHVEIHKIGKKTFKEKYNLDF